jgi:hypothetical protein
VIIPDYLAAIVGYRSWAVSPNGVLSGIAVAQPWAPKRALRAVCNGHDSATNGQPNAHLNADGSWAEAPVQACACGIYAVKKQATESDGANRAFGEVYLWGRIVEHEQGYRAEYAYPKSLTVCGTDELAERVRQVYGVPVERKEPVAADVYGQWVSVGVSGLSSANYSWTYFPNQLGAYTTGGASSNALPVDNGQSVGAIQPLTVKSKWLSLFNSGV